ncbi:calcium/sodium antiporter [Candidatus Saccharibacteria bacterium]|nr:calcium/sodium antiporter [Candidatus Saccharibacteria bacterium]
MAILLQIILLVVGFVLLIKGADIFVDGASSTAKHFGMPKILIGLTIVAFGTSAPEFAVSVKSLLAGSGDMMVGNVVGSNILNILLILGTASLIHSLPVKNSTLKKEIPLLILITIMFGTLMCDKLFGFTDANSLTRQDGLVLTLAFGIFMYYLVGMVRRRARRKEINAKLALEGKPEKYKLVEDDNVEVKPMSIQKAIVFIILGIAGIIIGSNFVVDSASAIARALGVSDALIALTIVAFGTSLPELVTSVVAARKGECDIAIGNVVGSNIFNIGIVAGIPILLLGGVSDMTSFTYVDVAVMLLATLLLFVFTFKDRHVGKFEGAIFLLVFLAYYGYTIAQALI